MTPEELRDIQTFAEIVVRKAGQQICESRRSWNVVKPSESTDITTNVDREVEIAVRDQVYREYPAHGWSGEEYGGEVNPESPTWIFDPVDGTYEFTHGIPLYCTALCLQHDNEVLVSAIYQPATNDLYSASKGNGAYHNNELIHISPQSELEKAFVLLRLPYGNTLEMMSSVLLNILTNTHRQMSIRNQNLALCWTAMGGYDGYLNLMGYSHWWDVAPGLLMLKEAGGVAQTPEGPLKTSTPKNMPYFAFSPTLMGEASEFLPVIA